MDVVLGFMKEEPYRRIDFDDSIWRIPISIATIPMPLALERAAESNCATCLEARLRRYTKTKTTYNPISDKVEEISLAQQHMLTFLTRWMQDFQIDGIRMDSVENVAHCNFIRDFNDEARKQFKARYSAEGDKANAKFLVVGEELTLPRELLTQQRLDGLWNERFQGLGRAALLGENVGGLNFEDTVRRAIDCRIEGVFTDWGSSDQLPDQP